MSDSTSTSNNDTITIHLTVTAAPGAPRVPLTLSKLASCTELRQEASAATHIDINQLKLIFRGRLVADQDDKKAVEEYRLEDASVLHCMGKPNQTATANGTTGAPSTASEKNATMSTTTAAAAVPVPVATSTPASTSVTSTVSPPSLAVALQQLKQANPPAVYLTAVTTLLKLLQNITQHPHEAKYRQVKKNNAAFGKRLGNVPHGDQVLRTAGFALESIEGEEKYVLTPHPQAWPQLLQHVQTVEQAVQAAQQQQQAQQVQPPVVPPTLSNGGAFPDMMANPMQQQMAANLMSNPQQLQAMLQNPMVQQMVRNDPRLAHMAPVMDQLAQDPNMAQQLSQMMQNPQLQQQMQQQMANANMNAQANGTGFPNFMPPAASNTASNRSSTNASAPPAPQNDNEQTEEEMIAEAIRRSLQDNNNN